MSVVDTYRTIQGPAEGVFKDRGSKFLAYAWPVQSEEDIQRHLEDLRKEHPKARHFCYAFRLGNTGALCRANDDGEPSGTAGKPILGQLVKHNLTWVLVVSVRYFGGTLLGTSGLINAYRESAILALEQAEIVEQVVCQRLRIHFDYALMGTIMNEVKKKNVEITHHSFDASPSIDIAIRLSEVEAMVPILRAAILEKPVEALNEEDEDREDLRFEWLE